MSLAQFFEARSIAIVGASSDPLRIGGRPVAALKHSWLPGGEGRRLFPVNPNRAEIQGLPAYPDIASIPGEIDLAIVAVPADAVAGAIEACAAAGCRAAVVFSSGFGETGATGRTREAELKALAARLNVRLLGPNCLGIVDSHAGLLATFTDAVNYEGHRAGAVGVASQSGAVMSQLMMLVRRRRVGLSKAISTGNEADIDLAEAIAFLVGDAQTKLIVCYCEMARNGADLVEALKAARQAGKPVIFIKSGRSEVGRSAALSHTGALAGADEIFDAVLAQYGVLRTDTLADAVDIAYVAARAPLPSGNRLGIVTISGGAGVMMADEASAIGLSLPPPSAQAGAALRDLVPYATVANPLDTTAQALNDLGVWSKCVETLMDGAFDAVVMSLAYFGESERLFAPLLSATRGLLGPNRPPVVFCSLFSAENAELAEEAGFLVFDDPSRAVRALAGWTRLGRTLNTDAPVAASLASANPEPQPNLAISADLSEAEAKQLVAAAGIPIPPERLARNADEARIAAREVGWPVVLKVCSADLPHKSEIGGVVLGLQDEDEVADAYDRIMRNAAEKRPDADIDGVLVSRQMKGGVELILGSLEDPAFGTIVMVGAGGVLTELFRDVRFRRAPLDDGDVREMLDGLRVSALLDGFRGAPACDREALVRTILDFSRLALRLAGAATIEINPLLVTPAGCVALDVLVQARRGETAQS